MSHNCPSLLFCPKTYKKLLALSSLIKLNPTNQTWFHPKFLTLKTNPTNFWTLDPNNPNLTHKFGQKYSLPELEEKVPDYVRIWCIFLAFWKGPTWYNMCPSFRDMSHDCPSPLFCLKTCKKTCFDTFRRIPTGVWNFADFDAVFCTSCDAAFCFFPDIVSDDDCMVL